MPRPATLIPILVLVAAPLLGTAITTLAGIYGEPIFTIGPFSIWTVDIPLIALSIAYGLFPILYNKFGLFRKHAEYTAIEYRMVMKILRIEIPLLALLTLYYFFFSPSNLEPYFNSLQNIFEESVYFFLFDTSCLNSMYFMLYSVVGGLLWIAFNKINRDFYFYLAKGSFENILEKDQIGQMQSMTRGLRYYNEYLEKVLKLKINNVDRVISKLLSDSKVDKHETIKSIYQAFEDNDNLQPITCISTTLAIQETEIFLVRQPVAEKIKNWTTYIIATIIPLIVSIVQLLFPASPTQPPG